MYQLNPHRPGCGGPSPRPEGPRIWQHDNAGFRQQEGLAPQAIRVQEQTALALRVQEQGPMKPALTVQDQQLVQSLRVKEHAEQQSRLSVAFTDAEAIGRSAQMNVPKGSDLFQEAPDRSRDENGVQMMATEAAKCFTAPPKCRKSTRRDEEDG